MSNWINIREKLPELYDYVLVFANTKGTNEPKPISIARLSLGKNNWEFISKHKDGSGIGFYQDLEWNIDLEDITHWMPLPNPPR